MHADQDHLVSGAEVDERVAADLAQGVGCPRIEEHPVAFREVARAGLIDYWTRTGHWPDFCAERDRPYDCPAVARELARPK